AYALLLNIAVVILYRLGWFGQDGFGLAEFGRILRRTAIQSGVILLLVGVSNGFSQVVAISRTPELITTTLLSLTENQYVFLFLVNVLLLIVGMVLDAGPAILILGPILAKAAAAYGVDPVHFAVMMCVNVTVG